MDPTKEKVRVGEKMSPETPVESRWMNPLNKIGWRKAIMARKTTHTLPDGRKFTLDYDRTPGKVLIKPVQGFVPMGWFDLEKVKREDGEWIVS